MSESHIGAGIGVGLAVAFIVVAVLIAGNVLSIPAVQDDDGVPSEYTIVTVYIDDSGTHYILEDQDGIQWMLTQYGTTVTLTEMTDIT